jgi:dihydroneopterin aldolase
MQNVAVADRNLLFSAVQISVMGKILLEGMEFFAYHGCFHEEQVIGTRFVVDIEYDFDSREAEATDRLSSTISYQDIYSVVRHEMERKSSLIEHVARRIFDSVRTAFPGITQLRVRVAKVSPALGGKLKQVSFEIGK